MCSFLSLVGSSRRCGFRCGPGFLSGRACGRRVLALGIGIGSFRMLSVVASVPSCLANRNTGLGAVGGRPGPQDVSARIVLRSRSHLGVTVRNYSRRRDGSTVRGMYRPFLRDMTRSNMVPGRGVPTASTPIRRADWRPSATLGSVPCRETGIPPQTLSLAPRRGRRRPARPTCETRCRLPLGGSA